VALPVLLEMILTGRRDVEAAEALGAIARTHACAEEIVTLIREALHTEDRSSAHENVRRRSRLVQALAEVPSSATTNLLEELLGDSEPAVALAARYLLAVRRP
jgi:hypothetical protein